MILPENRFPVFGIMRHCRARPGAKPLEPFGKGSNALKARTPDAGPKTGEKGYVLGSYRRFLRNSRKSVNQFWRILRPSGRPFSPRPGSSGSARYTRLSKKGKIAVRS